LTAAIAFGAPNRVFRNERGLNFPISKLLSIAHANWQTVVPDLSPARPGFGATRSQIRSPCIALIAPGDLPEPRVVEADLRDTRAMSQENLDLARRGYEAFARGDLDAAIEFMHPEIEAHDPRELPDAAIYRGREAVRRDWEQTSALFEDFSIDVEKSFDRGDEVVVFLRFRGRARESNTEVEAPVAHVWTIRDGKAVRLRQFLDRAEALEAVGLSPQDAAPDS